MAALRFCIHCGAANSSTSVLCCACQSVLDDPSSSQTTPSLLNERYQILSRIGSGGFGEVYKAQDIQEQRLVAIKQIHLKGLSTQEIIEATDAFNREARILTSLRHPQLPRVYNAFNDAEHWYLILDFIEGQTLDTYIQEQVARYPLAAGRLPLAELLAIGLQLCEVLHYLHAQQPAVIFRDLKPDNVMRSARGYLYLIDFGIARHFKPGQARDTLPFGSPGFAAPEQYGRAQTTPQADIYSLGALLYYLLSGDDPSEHPFQFPLLRPSGVAGTEELNALIQRMTALEPVERPAHIQEVFAELQRIQKIHSQNREEAPLWLPPEGQTPPALFSPPSSFQQTGRKTSRRFVLTTGLLIGGMAVAGGLVATLESKQMNKLINYVAPVIPPKNASLPSMPLVGFSYWSADLRYAVVRDPSGQALDVYDVQQQKLISTAQLKTAMEPGDSIIWSPDNSRFLYPAQNLAWNLRGSQPLYAPSERFSFCNAAAWSPNGRYLAMCFGDTVNRDFVLLDAGTGKSLYQASFSAYNVLNCFAWSPDGRYVAFPNTNNSNWVTGQPWSAAIWDSQTHQQVSQIGGILGVNPEWPSAITTTGMAWSRDGKTLALAIGSEIWLCQLTYNQAGPHLAQTMVLSDPQPFEWANSTLAWSPDLRYLAILQKRQGKWYVYDVTTGQRKSVVLSQGNQDGEIIAIAWSTDSKSIITVDLANAFSGWLVK